MLPSLWLNSASSTPPELAIREGEQVLGRSADADICLDETFVSGYHARLNWQNSQLAIFDLGSTNGTLVNGVPVVGWTSLHDGDVIEFGGVEATVRLPITNEPNSVVGSSVPPPPPAPSSLRQPDIDLRSDSVENDDPAGAGLENETSEERFYGSRLGPAVSEETEPLFDKPLTSAVTVPPNPTAGLSITGEDRDAGQNRDRFDDLDGAGFDFGDHVEDQPSSTFDNRGLRVTIGTMFLVFITVFTIAALIIYLIR